MMKKWLCQVTGGILLWSFVTGTGWAGQVVTDSHRNWAKVAVAQEKALEGAGTPGTLAILYFINDTGSPALDPVQKGFAYMLITDLSKVDGLQLVERAKLQALVEEIGLGKSGLVDPDTAPRVGRLLGAAQVVGGKFYKSDLEQFGIDPGVLNTSDAKLTDLPDSKGLLEEIFRMEKDVLFGILDNLKITPATKEIEAELRKPMTTSLEALIFLFRGFHESDQGNYQMAANFYRMALKADPGLIPASDSLKELEVLGLIGRTNDSRAFLRSLRDRTSLTDQLSPDQVVRRTRTPLEVEKRQSLRPPKPDDVDNDKDGFTENQGDCNDTDATIHPGAAETCGDGIDQDCNGSDLKCPEDIDNDGDGYTERQGDCNDGSAGIHPGATEICGDSIDQDCNGSDAACPPDPNDVDNDSDGYTERQGDCNDGSAGIHPGATEICGDSIDQDCNGSDLACPVDIDGDGDGYKRNQGDCNDTDASIHPGAVEICSDGIDQDCDGSDAICPDEIDNDADGYTEKQGDCNDGNWEIHPGARELCGDGIDQDCNGSDLSCSDDIDNDRDGYTVRQGDCNDANVGVHPGAVDICGDSIDQDCNGSDTICPPDPNDADNDGDGYTERQGDCNDGNASIHPGAVEICGDSIDQDCNGSDEVCPPDPNDVDNDGDGYTERQGDCNDGNASIHPGAVEKCGDSIDQDCNGSDEACPPDPNDVDNDGDGYTETMGDCNDGNASIHPGATEICNDQIDQDCDGIDCTINPNDIDNDGDGYTENQGDCNDSNQGISPIAAEICDDGVDNNCDGLTDCGDTGHCMLIIFGSGSICVPID
ncbi:MAG: MopE-related protein [Pseudomonadota bacterium]